MPSTTTTAEPCPTGHFLSSWVVWGLTMVVTLTSLVLVIYIDRSCEFVRIIGRNNETNASIDGVSFYRGIHRGQLEPEISNFSSSCQPWGSYNKDETKDFELDTKMILARIASTLSIILGGYVLACQVFWIFLSSENKMNRVFRWTSVVASFVVAVCQAMTHLMVKSDLCEAATPISITSPTSAYFGGDEYETSGWETTIIWDECQKDTTAYLLTFVTMATWLIISAMLATAQCISSSSTSTAQPIKATRGEDDAELDDTTGDGNA